ncbi:hypothetical protein THRCLA_05223, partial [Thraustotheca clavata]
MLHAWVQVTIGVAIGLAACLIIYILYECIRRLRARPLDRISRFESSHLLARTDMEWPIILPEVSQSFLSPIPEETYNGNDDVETAYGVATKEKEFCKAYCENSKEYMWLDKPALYMGRSRTKRMYLIGQAAQNNGYSFHNSYMSSFRKQYVLTMYPTQAQNMIDVPLLKEIIAQIALCPQVVPVLDVFMMNHATTPRIAAITPWMNQGSLKDYIFHRSQTMILPMPYHKKFKRYGSGKPLASSAIARLGRDILLGMQQLQSLGIPSYHLHTGNILMEYEQVRLTGYEALLFQAGRLDSPQPVVHDSNLPLILFGHVLYEMTFGVELTPDRLGDDGVPTYANLCKPSDRILDVLDAIFLRQENLSIESLLQMPLFIPRAQRPSQLQRRLTIKPEDIPVPKLTDNMYDYIDTCLIAFHDTPLYPSSPNDDDDDDTRENHLKTAGVPQYIHAEGAATGPITPSSGTMEAFRAVKMKRQFRFVFFRIDGNLIEVESSAPPSATASDLCSALPHADCRYIIYDHEMTTSDGRKTSKLYFILWAPATSNPQSKMAYSYAKGNFRGQCEGCFDLNASSSRDIEIGIGLVSADEDDSE